MTAPNANPVPSAAPAPATAARPNNGPNNGYTTGRRMAAGRLKLSYFGSVRAEFTKLASLKSTWWLLGITVALMVLGSVLNAVSYKAMSYMQYDETTGSMTTLAQPKPLEGYVVWSSLVNFIPTVAIVIGIFGIMAITSEYTNLTIQSGLVANPRRGMYLAAKGTVVALLALAASLLGIAFGWVAMHLTLGDVPVSALPDSQRMLPVICIVGGPATCMFMALLTLGIGAICRSTVSGVFALIGVWMILPTILSIATMSETLSPAFRSIINVLPNSVMGVFLNGSVNDALTSMIDTGASSVTPEINYFDPTWWQAGLIFVAWSIVLYAIGALVMKRADIK